MGHCSFLFFKPEKQWVNACTLSLKNGNFFCLACFASSVQVVGAFYIFNEEFTTHILLKRLCLHLQKKLGHRCNFLLQKQGCTGN